MGRGIEQLTQLPIRCIHALTHAPEYFENMLGIGVIIAYRAVIAYVYKKEWLQRIDLFGAIRLTFLLQTKHHSRPDYLFFVSAKRSRFSQFGMGAGR